MFATGRNFDAANFNGGRFELVMCSKGQKLSSAIYDWQKEATGRGRAVAQDRHLDDRQTLCINN